ncbi:unnamed protein product [Cylicostephanus goldi]|uniref:Uncharacterized protein n=1 Tax=Cylicostephanus goldi TaxID=71465 RepID=A0A3P6U987_CYLGO|nr:unnamed protein product [Cylicostephanus goldi]
MAILFFTKPFRSQSRESSVALPSTEVVVDEFGGFGVQTALSIRMPLWSESDIPTSRKSSRSDRRSASVVSMPTTSSVPSSSSSSRYDTEMQTEPVRIELEDNVVVGYPLSDMLFAPPSNSLVHVAVKEEKEVLRSAHCTTDQTSRIVSWEDVLDGSFKKKYPQKRMESATSLEEQVHVWNVVACGFSDPQGLQNFILATSYNCR